LGGQRIVPVKIAAGRSLGSSAAAIAAVSTPPGIGTSSVEVMPAATWASCSETVTITS
jgi:hypothetical protein